MHMEDLKQRATEERDRLLDIEEVAHYLNVSKTAVYRLVARRTIPFHRFPGGLRFSMADVEQYLASCRVAPLGPTQYGCKEN